MEFIKIPNLPEKRVGGVLVDYRIGEESIKIFKKWGINVHHTCEVGNLYSAVYGHADMMFAHIENNRFICEPSVYEYYKKMFENTGAEILKGKKYIKSTYPDDVAYNIAIIENIVIHKLRYTDDTIICYLKKQGKNLINIAQGYSKCNTCIISNNAVITEDVSIKNALENTDVDVLKISSGSVKLKGMKYGFLGGASGLIDRDLLVVNGNIETHDDCDKIIEFCKKYGVKVLSLTDDLIEDVGSIIPIYY